MSGSAENTAHETPGRPQRPQGVVNLGTASRMLALVRPIVADVLHYQKQLAGLQAEQERLDRQRLKLAWAGRSRRYQVRDEATAAERQLQAVLTELEALGVALLDAETGRVGFPTVVNDRAAFFSWQPDDEGLRYWHFAGDASRRPIPASWAKQADIRLVGGKR